MVKIYGDNVSPCVRSVTSFLKINNIPYEEEFISLLQGKNTQPEYLAVNPMGKLPTMEDNGLILAESVAILQYLVQSKGLEDPWYPSDPFTRAAVDRFLSWYHLNLREHIALLPFRKLIAPRRNIPVSPEEIKDNETLMPKILGTMNTWLTENDYLAGTQMTIADLVGYHELSHGVILLGINLSAYPKLHTWFYKINAMPEIVEVETTIKAISASLIKPIIYGFRFSAPSNAVEAFCKCAEIDYEFVKIDAFAGEQAGPMFSSINPQKYVPALVEGQFTLYEGVAILQYLAESKNVDDSWYPKDPRKRARIDRFLNWFYPNFRMQHEAIMFNKVFAPAKGWPVTGWKLQMAEAQYPAAVGQLESWLGETEFFGGDDISIADIYAVSCIAGMRVIKFDMASYPKLQAWFEKVYNLEGVKETFEELERLIS